jgi:hypothetical protein
MDDLLRLVGGTLIVGVFLIWCGVVWLWFLLTAPLRHGENNGNKTDNNAP